MLNSCFSIFIGSILYQLELQPLKTAAQLTSVFQHLPNDGSLQMCALVNLECTREVGIS